MASRYVAVVALVAIMIIWGSSFAVTKAAIAELPPFTMGLIRVAIGALVLLPFALARLKSVAAPLPWRWIVASAVFGVTLYYIVFNSSLTYTTASQGALVQSSIPAVTALIAILWLREPASPARLVGIGLSIVGVVIVFLHSGAEANVAAPAPALGNLLMFASVICWGLYTAITKRVAQFDPILITTCITAIGAVLLVPFAAIELWGHALPQPSLKAWLGVTYLGVLASGAGYLLYNFALKQMAASQVGVFTNLIPIVGVLTGVVALGEPLSWQAIAGGLIVMLGVWLTVAK